VNLSEFELLRDAAPRAVHASKLGRERETASVRKASNASRRRSTLAAFDSPLHQSKNSDPRRVEWDHPSSRWSRILL